MSRSLAGYGRWRPLAGGRRVRRAGLYDVWNCKDLAESAESRGNDKILGEQQTRPRKCGKQKSSLEHFLTDVLREIRSLRENRCSTVSYSSNGRMDRRPRGVPGR